MILYGITLLIISCLAAYATVTAPPNSFVEAWWAIISIGLGVSGAILISVQISIKMDRAEKKYRKEMENGLQSTGRLHKK